MIRAAKKGTKILIADETSDLLDNQFKKSVFLKKHFKEQEIDLNKIK